MKTPILGGSYTAVSVNAACSRMVNLFPEIVPEGGKEAAFLQRAPGFRTVTTCGVEQLRGFSGTGDPNASLYVVSGEELWKFDYLEDGGVLVGTGLTGGYGDLVSIADNGRQLFIACNPDGFIFDKQTETLTQITDPDFPGAVTVSYLDGYFVFNEPFSQKLWVTALLDGTSIDALDFASAEGAPDNIVGLIVYNRQVWVFGNDTTELWENVPDGANFPLARSGNGFFEIGCIAPKSIARLDNRIFWLGRDSTGSGIVYASEGYGGKRVSNHAVEQQIQRYSNMNDAEAYTYQQAGHSYYVLNFPLADTTWVYDVATQVWHERAGFLDGEFTRNPIRMSINFRNRVIVAGDDNILSELRLDVFDHGGKVMRWLRSWRALDTGTNPLKYQEQHSLQLDCESGTGLAVDLGSNPQVMLRWSDDAGHTWSREHWAAMGKSGDYKHRVMWRRLGMTLKLRDRVYEVSGSDPVKVTITGAELHGAEEQA